MLGEREEKTKQHHSPPPLKWLQNTQAGPDLWNKFLGILCLICLFVSFHAYQPGIFSSGRKPLNSVCCSLWEVQQTISIRVTVFVYSWVRSAHASAETWGSALFLAERTFYSLIRLLLKLFIFSNNLLLAFSRIQSATLRTKHTVYCGVLVTCTTLYLQGVSRSPISARRCLYNPFSCLASTPHRSPSAAAMWNGEG